MEHRLAVYDPEEKFGFRIAVGQLPDFELTFGNAGREASDIGHYRHSEPCL